ncbi:DUF1707 SHOCT-like domain-containing protein [Nocardia flavorosea]|uniref:DUF1707 domain-containing protein n=1 Tax=Nocardia flavorosea TaxID=53429 RepID=A0A846YQP6_9NOCA|nr:DUF1707 domain-containing protein [Nocardia flavorosea]NKY59844.1 DUF1707 domain-containing protein [Nocardia flavorosea]
MSELPGARITVGERERALRELAEHLGAGRLTLTDYEERAAAATVATTRPELAVLFADMPGAAAPPGELQHADPATGFAIMGGCAATFALVLALVFGGWLWLLLLVVLLVSAPLVPVALRRRRLPGPS